MGGAGGAAAGHQGRKSEAAIHSLKMLRIVLLVLWAVLAQLGSTVARRSLHSRFASLPLLPLANATTYLPVVIWHGMGDSCCDPGSIGAVAEDLRRSEPGLFVHSIATGPSLAADISSTYFGNVNDQIARVCDELATLPAILAANGRFVAVGFSQGGQFLRAVMQRCGDRGGLRPHTLVTMGAQHQGVMELPGCSAATPTWMCAAVERALDAGAYVPWVQHHIVQAQYWKDPDDLEAYYERSGFLADINAEAAGGDAALYSRYRRNLVALERLVLVQFDADETVVPRESSHFGFYDGEKVVPLRDSDLYRKEDRLGLRELDESGRLVLAHAPGFHMQFSLEWFWEHVAEKYLVVQSGGDADDDVSIT
jgi:palmitoyl-protein thioesterase